MKALAIDTSSSTLSIAVSDGEKIFCNTDLDNTGDTIGGRTKHSEHVMGCIDIQMKKAGLTPQDIDIVLCMGGPGSFTGLRIGYSIAKALALSLSIPFAPIPTLDCITYQIKENPNLSPEKDNIILSVTDSRKNAWFYAFYKISPSVSNVLTRLTSDTDGDVRQISQEIAKIAILKEKVILTGADSQLLWELFPQDIQKNVVLINRKKGYAKDMIYVAKSLDLSDNYSNTYLYAGPEYAANSV